MMREIEIRPVRAVEATASSALVLAVFEAFVAPHYGPEGRATFQREAAPKAMAKRLADGHTALVACTKAGDLVGYIEVENYHICELFVAGPYQRRSMGRDLLAHALRGCEEKDVTVNAALGSDRAYARYGFTPTGPWTTSDGLTFRPMIRRARCAADSPR